MSMNVTHITPQEATKLLEVLSLTDFHKMKPFVDEIARRYPDNNATFNIGLCALVMFNAGRVEGIRAERARRAGEKDTTIAAINRALSYMGEREKNLVYQFARELAGSAPRKGERRKQSCAKESSS